MLARRLGIGLAVAVLVIVVIASVAARVQQDDRAVAPPPTTVATPAREVAGELPNDKTIRASVGDIVSITVRTQEDDTATIDAFGEEADTAPNVPGMLEFVAYQAGTFPVVLEMSGNTIGELVVEPAAS